MSDPRLPDRYVVLDTVDERFGRRLVRARDTVLEREVFIQLPDANQNVAAPDRAMREARALAKCRHERLVRLLEIVESESGPILVLEPFGGELLGDLIARRGALSPDVVRGIAIDAAEALQVVHAAGIVHRGVSEYSIFVDADGRVVVVHGFDFAKPFDMTGRTSLWHARRGAGEQADSVPDYSAPEQLHGIAADARTDVYALGCVLQRALGDEPGVPADLAAAIERCQAPAPMQRFVSMAELASALRAQSTVETGRRGRDARKWAALAMVFLMLGLAVWFVANFTDGTARGKPLPDAGARHAESPQPTYGSTYDSSRALLIGVDYADPASGWHPFALENAERDVRAIRDALLELGWKSEDVRLLSGAAATLGGIEAALRELYWAVGEEDQVLIYYAGHGVKHEATDESGWAIPADASAPPERGGEGRNWLHFDRFDRVLREFRAKHILIALDCCHGGAGMSRLRAGEIRAGEEQLGSYLREPARIMIASSRPNEVALDGAGRNSPFASAFVSALQDAKRGAVSASGILARAQAHLVTGSAGRQRPMLMTHPSSSPGAEFFFVQRD